MGLEVIKSPHQFDGNVTIVQNLSVHNNVTMLQNLSVAGTITTPNLFVTNLSAISATITNIDIKNYELSGYTVDGNFTVNGTASADNIVTNNALINNNLTVAGSISAVNAVVVETVSAANFEITDAPIGPGTTFNGSVSTFLIRLDGEWYGLPLVETPPILLYNNELVLYDNFILNYNG